MSSDGFRDAVLTKARADAEALLIAAQKDAEAVVAAATDRADRAATEVVARAKREAETGRSRELSSLDRELRLAALGEKNALLDKVLVEAASAFTSQPADQLSALYAKELGTVDVGDAQLLVAKGASAQFEAARSKGAQVKEDASIEGGYIVAREDFRLDRTLKARIDELKMSMRGELAQVLFQEKA